MFDSTIQLATCNRCGAYVFSGRSNGLNTAADPAPVDQARYISALMAGRRTFDLIERAGRPHSLRTRSKASPAPIGHGEGSTEPLAYSRQVFAGSVPAVGGSILAEHACSTDSTGVEVIPQGPPQAPVTPDEGTDGLRPHPVPAGALRGLPRPAASSKPNPRSPAPPATRHRSDTGHILPGHVDPPGQPACDKCGYRIDNNEAFTGLHHNTWKWAYHERCPNVEEKEATRHT